MLRSETFDPNIPNRVLVFLRGRRPPPPAYGQSEHPGPRLTARSLAVLNCAATLLLFSGTALAQLDEASLAERQSRRSVVERFRASYIGLNTYLGNGALTLGDGYRNVFVSEQLIVLPRFALTNTKSVRLLWQLDCELSEPDRVPARRCQPGDLRLSYHDIDLWRPPRLDGQVMGFAALYFPTSYGSRQNKTVLNARIAAGYMTRFARNKLQFVYMIAVQKYFPTSKTRGDCPASLDQEGVGRDHDGLPLCFGRSEAGSSISASTAGDIVGSAGSGGRLNDNWLLLNSATLQYFFHARWSAAVSLGLFNFFRFSVPDTFDDRNLSSVGRSDMTWGNIQVSYQPQRHVVLSLGITSFQPALTADGDFPRFPFYDFVSPNNNYTRWFFAGTFVY